MNLEIDPKIVGLRIRDIRKRLGLSMTAFAERIDQAEEVKKTKSGTVSNWETGKNLPNNTRLKKIAELGDISVDELLYGNLHEFAKAKIRKTLYERNNLDSDQAMIEKLEITIISMVFDSIKDAFGDKLNFDSFNDRVLYSTIDTVLSSINYRGNLGLVTNAYMNLVNFSNYYLHQQLEANEKLGIEIDSELIDKIQQVYGVAIGELMILIEEYEKIEDEKETSN